MIARLIREGKTLEAYNQLYTHWHTFDDGIKQLLASRYLRFIRQRHEALYGRTIL